MSLFAPGSRIWFASWWVERKAQYLWWLLVMRHYWNWRVWRAKRALRQYVERALPRNPVIYIP